MAGSKNLKKKKKKNITYLPNKMTRKCMEVSTEDRSGKFENHLEAMLLDVLNGVTVGGSLLTLSLGQFINCFASYENILGLMRIFYSTKSFSKVGCREQTVRHRAQYSL